MAGKNQIDMLNGPLLRKIFVFALPLAASSILQQLFNSADVAVVGRFAGKEALAAVGSNGPVINIIINLFVGLSIGANVLIGSLIGQDRKSEIKAAAHTVVSVALISGLFLLFFGMSVAPLILRLIGTPDNVVGLASVYLRVYFVGMPFVMFYNFGAAILRSKGDTKRPLLALVIAGVVNVLLNLLLVIVFHLGVLGVALATVASNVVSALLVLFFLLTEEGVYRLIVKDLSIKRKYLVQIVKIGVPAGIQGMVFSLSNLCIQSAINGFGSAAMAGSAAALNYEYFTYFVVNAFGQSAVTFTSQNYGAKKYDRCKKIFALCMASCLTITFAESLVFVLGRNFFVSVYTVDSSAFPYALTRMIHVELFGALPATYEIGAASLRAMDRSMLPSVLILFGTCVVRVLWVFTVFRRFSSYSVLMNVYPVTWCVTGLIVIAAYLVVRKRAFQDFDF